MLREKRSSDLSIERKLIDGGVEVCDFVNYYELSRIYNRSSSVLVPCALHGGGERAVLEARACGCNVEIRRENEKLFELSQGPIYSHKYYAQQIISGLESVMKRG